MDLDSISVIPPTISSIESTSAPPLLITARNLVNIASRTLTGLQSLLGRYSDSSGLVSSLIVEVQRVADNLQLFEEFLGSNATAATDFISEQDAEPLIKSLEMLGVRMQELAEDAYGALAGAGQPSIWKPRRKIWRVAGWERARVEKTLVEVRWQVAALKLLLSCNELPPFERKRKINLFVSRTTKHYDRDPDSNSIEDLSNFADLRIGTSGSGGSAGQESSSGCGGGASTRPARPNRSRGWSFTKTPFEPDHTPPLLSLVAGARQGSVGSGSSSSLAGTVVGPGPAPGTSATSTTATSGLGTFPIQRPTSSSSTLPPVGPQIRPLQLDLDRESTASVEHTELEFIQSLIQKAEKAYNDNSQSEGAKWFHSALGIARCTPTAEDLELDCFSIAERWAVMRLKHSEWDGVETVLKVLSGRVGEAYSERLFAFHSEYVLALLQNANEFFRTEKFSVARKICKVVHSILKRLSGEDFDVDSLRIELNFTWASILMYDSGLPKAIALLEPIIKIEDPTYEEAQAMYKANDMLSRIYFMKSNHDKALHHAQAALNGLRRPAQFHLQNSNQNPTHHRLMEECISLLSEIHAAKGEDSIAAEYRALLPPNFLPFLWNANDLYAHRVQMLLIQPTLSSALHLKDRTTLRALLSWETPQINSRKESWLHTLSRKNESEALSLLLSRKDIASNINLRMEGTGFTPLHIACSYARVEAVTVLLARPEIDINAADVRGRTPLHILLSHVPAQTPSQTSIFQKLLSNPSIRINLQDSEGFTPLHEAFRRGNVGIIRSLLARREIGVQLRDKSGRLAVECVPTGTAGERLRKEFEGYFGEVGLGLGLGEEDGRCMSMSMSMRRGSVI